MNSYLRNVAFFLLFGFVAHNSQAQCSGVWVPDPVFRAFLKKNYSQAIGPSDSLLPCQAAIFTGRMNCSRLGITNLSGISYFKNLTELVCEGNKLTNLPTLPDSLRLLYCANNQLSSLPTLPSGLVTLEASNNQLTSLPALPFGLTVLSLYKNQLINLPNLPSDLQSLYISNNQIATLSPLPDSLYYLICDYNQLTSLPLLPNSVISLFCSNNQLTSLPNIPDSLSFLNFSNNRISSLPFVPNTLKYLSCSNNQLSVLPVLPLGLQDLWCAGNQLTTLPTLYDNIRRLDCSNNQLSSIQIPSVMLFELRCSGNQLSNLPTLPSGLYFLYCDSNQLAVLPTLPENLVTLSCKYNQLTSLPVLPANLQVLDCGNNQLSGLPQLPDGLNLLSCNNNRLNNLPTLPLALKELRCGYNLLDSLPVLPQQIGKIHCENNRIASLPDSLYTTWLTELNCSGNQLVKIPVLPEYFEVLKCDSNYLRNLPRLPEWMTYLGAAGNFVTCLPNIPSRNPFTSNIGLRVCPSAYTCVDSNIIKGVVFLDLNGNRFQGPNEMGYPNAIVSSGNRLAVTDHLGRYSIYTDRGTYRVRLEDVPDYYENLTFVLFRNVIFESEDSIANGINFAIVPTPGVVDVEAVLTPLTEPIPGQPYCYTLTVSNVGTYKATCTVTLSPDPQLNYNGPVLFAINNLPINQIWDTTLCMTVPAHLSKGASLVSSINANTILLDADAANNSHVAQSIVNDHWVSNHKYCSDSVIGTQDVADGNRLVYTIRFQNTGDKTVNLVEIEDTLDVAHLNVSSLKVLSASHNYAMSFIGDHVLKFDFQNINLPDSASNPLGSQGYITYSVKPLVSLSTGAKISNKAQIYYDYRKRVVTNTVVTEVINTTGLQQDVLNSGKLALHPNPSNGLVVLDAQALAGQQVNFTVLDLAGKSVYQVDDMPFTGQQELDLSDLPTGCYIVRLAAGGGVLSQKLVLVR